jgi:serine/threonine-protein kinase RsbW
MNLLQVSCEIQNLRVIRDFVKSRLQDFQITGSTGNQIVLAVDEACANSIIHQHKCDGTTQLELKVYKEDDKIVIEIKDIGKAFPLHIYKPRKVEDIVKLRAKGGLGILLIHSIMDEIIIKQEKKYCVYIFSKRLPNR